MKALVDGFGNQAQGIVFAAGGAGAGMNDDAEQAQRLGAIEFVDEGGDRLLAEQRQGGGEIDQVTGV